MKALSNILSILTLTLAPVSPILAQDKDESPTHDFINFKNDDLLRGEFLGFTTSGKIIWKNQFADQNIAFEKNAVRKIVKNSGKLTRPFQHTSIVKLKNNDVLPGKITNIEDDKLIIETDYSGTLSITKESISSIEFNPHGNQIIYRGPFAEEKQWQIKYSDQNRPDDLDEKEKKEANDKENAEEKTEKKPATWQIKNFSLQHIGKPSSIVMDAELPDKFRITYSCHTNLNYYPSITVLADLNVPEYDKENKTLEQNRTRYKSATGSYLGSSIEIKPRSSSASLVQYGYNEDGSMFQDSVTNEIKNTTSRSNNSKAFYDLRVDKTKGLVMFYINRKHIGQWHIDDLATKLTGNHLGFNMQYSNSKSVTVISDIVISKWNGVQDSALSLENDERDIVMLGNGTDRYSGEITEITDSVVGLNTSYAELSIPHDQVSSVNFAGGALEELKPLAKEHATIRFYGTGNISGKISKAEDGYISLESSTLGTIKVNTEYISSFEFVHMDHVYDVYK